MSALLDKAFMEVSVRQVSSAAIAEQQEAAVSHVREAIAIVQNLLAGMEVADETAENHAQQMHRMQLEQALVDLEEAADYLGPVVVDAPVVLLPTRGRAQS